MFTEEWDREKFSKTIDPFNNCIYWTLNVWLTLKGVLFQLAVLFCCCFILQFCFVLFFFSSVTQNYIVLFLRKPGTRYWDRQPSLSPESWLLTVARKQSPSTYYWPQGAFDFIHLISSLGSLLLPILGVLPCCSWGAHCSSLLLQTLSLFYSNQLWFLNTNPILIHPS